MKYLLCVLSAIMVLCACAPTTPEAHGPVSVPPAAPSGPSAAVEDLLAQQAAAQIKATVAAYDAKLATTSVAKAAAEKDAVSAHAEAKADAAAIAEQGRLDLKAQFARFYWTAAFLLLIEAVLLYEAFETGSKLVRKLAAINGIIVATCAAIPSLADGLIDHEALIRFLLGASSLSVLVYHYRTRIETEGKTLFEEGEAKAKVLLLALEHAVSHIHMPDIARHVEWDVEHAVLTAWEKFKLGAQAVERALHLTKAPAPIITGTVSQGTLPGAPGSGIQLGPVGVPPVAIAPAAPADAKV